MDGICVCDFNRSKLVIIKIFLNDVNYVDFTSEIIETIEIKQNEPLNIRPMRRISVNK